MTPHRSPAPGGYAHYLRPLWLFGHLVVCALFVLCIRLGWWQMRSAFSGQVLSFGYALQWPAFAGFGVFLWARIVRQHARERQAGPATLVHLPAAGLPPNWSFSRDSRQVAAPATTAPLVPVALDDDPDLQRYNDMLAWLRADPRRHPNNFPRRGFPHRTVKNVESLNE